MRFSSRWDALTIDEISNGSIAVGGDFEISGHFCVPPTPRNGENILMIASHGVGFSKGSVSLRSLPFCEQLTDWL